jgi:RNA polymerase sigma-32 factor
MYLPAADSDPSVAVEEEEWEDSTAERLGEALETLDARSQDILKSRWMTENKATLHELAARYNVSAERIRQIEANAIKKLRALIAPEAVIEV